jgi:hypothetical protein
LKEKLSAKAVKRRIEGHIQAGRLPDVQYRRAEHARGYDIRLGAQGGGEG